MWSEIFEKKQTKHIKHIAIDFINKMYVWTREIVSEVTMNNDEQLY